MSQLLEVVLPKHNADSNMVLKPQAERTACVCCLKQNVAFVNLTTCKHTGFLNTFADFMVLKCTLEICSLNLKLHIFQKIFTNSVICHHCHNTLKKIEDFRHQVGQSILILKKQTRHSVITKSQNLGIYVIENMTIVPIITENIQKQKHNEFEVEIADVKVECDMSDMDTDMPLLEIKKQEEVSVENHITKSDMNSKPIKKEKAEDSSLISRKNTGKLEMLFLTLEELQKERELLKNEEKYLKLPFKCNKCIIGYTREPFFKKHCKQKHDQSKGKYICGVCETVFESKETLDPHYKRHFIGYECKPCSKRYIDERTAVTHYKEMHDNVGTVPNRNQCNIADCGFETQCKDNACARTHAPAAAPYCAACRKHFSTNFILQQHLKHHSNHVTEADKKYKCDECGSRFTMKSTLRGHIEWAHLKKSDHRCPQCFKIFRTSRNVLRHIEYVHKKKEMPRDKICDQCGKGFTSRQCLQAHIRTHTGERPYKCTQCSSTFTQSGALYKHKSLVHNLLRGDTKRNKRKIK